MSTKYGGFRPRYVGEYMEQKTGLKNEKFTNACESKRNIGDGNTYVSNHSIMCSETEGVVKTSQPVNHAEERRKRDFGEAMKLSQDK